MSILRKTTLERKVEGLNYWLKFHGALERGYRISSPRELCNSEICSKCKGLCCKSFPCVFASTDLPKVNEKTCRMILDTGIVSISIDNLEHIGTFYTLRPMAYSDNGRISTTNIVTSGINSCCRLYDDKKGCMLDAECRPASGLLLVPFDCCYQHYRTDNQEYDWARYRKLMIKLYGEYFGKKVEDGAKQATEEQVKMLQKILKGA